MVFNVICVAALFGQCPVSDFNVSSNACLNEQLELTNNAANSSSFEWFFCSTDYEATPASKKLASGYGAVYYSKFLQYDGNLYLFFVSQTQNKLVGLRITNPETLAFEVHCEIDLSAVITNPAGIDIINDNGIWVGLITSIVAPYKLVKITFDDNIETITDSDDLTPEVALATPFDVKFLQEGNNYYAFIANTTAPVDKQILRLSFGSSLSNTPEISYIRLPAASQAASFDFYNSCNAWTGFVSSRNGKIFRIDFNDGLATPTPVVTDLTLSTALNDPGGLALAEEHDQLIFIIQSRNGNVYTGNISLPTDNTVEVVDLGNIKSSSRDWDVEVFRFEGKYKVVTTNFTNGGLGGLYSLDFPQLCGGNVKYSARESETISFAHAGTYNITLKATNAEGDKSVLTKQVLVSDTQAPQLAVTHPSVNCVSSPVLFSFESDLSLSNQIWNFGDGMGTSTDLNPEYSYGNAGDFSVKLQVTAENGCHNLSKAAITIYDTPISGFALPPNLLCTNNAFTFTNNTPDTYDGNLSYQWYVNNDLVSTERDLQHTFIVTGSKEIKLITSIPGCADEITQTTSPVEAGPVVDFSFTGACEDESFHFTNEIAEPVESYSWDFGEGNTSSDPNPINTFQDFGNYSVSLTATNAIGCQNKRIEVITVASKPFIDFEVPAPPWSCTGSPTQFLNRSNSPDGSAITTWAWNFRDPDSPASQSEKDPEHIFADAGIYNVSLSATTEFGCSATAQKEITITQSPSTEFTFTPACDDASVVFAVPSPADIDSWYWEMGTAYYLTSTPTHTFRSPGDYPVYLEVTGINGCSASTTKTIHVPQPLQPDFSFIKACIDEEAVFTDVTTGTDPIISREWDFNGLGTSTLSPALFSFHEAGDKNIQLKVTAASGCRYQVNKQVSILPVPVAGFSASPLSGAQPLEVGFTNTSAQATQYLWRFSDGTGSTSTEASPVYTFHGVGQFGVELIASNAQQCEDTFQTVITTVGALPDVDLEMISVSTNPDGSSKMIITINNKGNTVLKDLPIDIDFSGGVKLREIVEGPIAPASQYNLVLRTGIANPESLRYVCVSVDLVNDLSPQGNRICKEFENILFVFPVYPNPVKESLHLEWIAEKDRAVRVLISDAMGRNVLKVEFAGNQGLNEETVDLSTLQNGIYQVVIDDGFNKSTQRILIQASCNSLR